MTRSSLFASLPLGTVLLGAALGCSSPPPTPPPAPELLAQASARTAWVHPRPARGVPLTEAPAHVLPSPEGAAALGLPFRASVTRIAVRPGQRVRRGDVLLDVLMPEVVQAAGRHQAASLRRQAYARRVEQLQSLRAQGMARVFELAEAEAELADALAEQQGALALLRIVGLEASAADTVARRGAVPLRSPVEGIVTEVSAVLGETRESGAAPLVRVVGEGEARIQARLSRSLPDEASFEFSAPGLEALPLRLVGRAPEVDSRDGTTAAWFEPETPRSLPAGLQGTVRVRADTLPDVRVVPARALLLEGGQATVLVRSPEGHRRQPVQVLVTSGTDALVRGPLREEDAVAADAGLALAGEVAP